MQGEDFVRKAVELAKKQGVLFDDKSPTFRPTNNPSIFHVIILTNKTPNSSGEENIDKHFDFLSQFTEKSLANYFIRVFNERNIEQQANEIIDNK